LALVGIEMAKAVPAVRDHDPRIRTDERVELLAVAVLGDLQERRLRGGRGPQRTPLTAGPPAGLIDMHRALIEHGVLELQVRAGQGF
jgi:putative component of toxin-antitoxin plasmid stabilization module